MSNRAPKVLVFDSGLGGLTVLAEIRSALAGARLVYVADDAAFPYGGIGETDLVERVVSVIDRMIAVHEPDLVVIACNTASTIALPALRARFSIPFVGTVPAIKPATETTLSGRVSVLATQGTIRRDYTRALIDTYAADVSVTLVGAIGLAALAEAHLKGEPVADEDVVAEIAPCFVDAGGRRTDVVVLACTHYPLLMDVFHRVAPWPVTWIDPAAAIARRAGDLIGPIDGHAAEDDATAVFTRGTALTPTLHAALAQRGLPRVTIEPLPLAKH